MRILGISTLGRGSAVALLDENAVLFAIEEEKLNRQHNSLEIPRLALERCLHETQMKLSEFRAIALADRNVSKDGALRKHSLRSNLQDQLIQLLRDGPRFTRFIRVRRNLQAFAHAATNTNSSGSARMASRNICLLFGNCFPGSPAAFPP